MSRKINQKKEAFLASGGLLRSAGLAVPVAGVSSISKSNYIHQAHHLNRPVMQQHPGRVRGPHFCMKLRHYKILHSVPAPVFSPNAPRYKLKFGVVPNVGFSRRIGSRGALFSPATFPSGVFIASEVTPSCKPTAGRASRLIRLDSDAASPMQSVSACGSAGSLSSHQTRISP